MGDAGGFERDADQFYGAAMSDKKYLEYKEMDKSTNFLSLDGNKNWSIGWDYPEIYDNEKQNWVELDLIHTRASDSIRIKYDSKRNGYVIEQASRFEWDGNDEVCDQDWQEVAFVEAYARDVRVHS